MEQFNFFVNRHFKISLGFLALGFLFGLIYSLNLLGLSVDSVILEPSRMRSVHISLMLYGFITLMLSMLPFLLINKEVGSSQEGLRYLNLYFIFWYIFLFYMVMTLLFGVQRGLAFYDFHYALNFILALAGIFYAVALYKFIQLYEKTPTWVNVSFKIVLIAPIALLILMNPYIGQVESTVTGPHGDNTLGMSLAIIPLYYLIMKLVSEKEFIARWNILWIVPLGFYFASVLYRTFYEPLTYNQEWFLQYLSLAYLPLLYRWYVDAKIKGFAKVALFISIVAFLFVDVEGNLLFIPEIRWPFHRNDLIIAHAHLAMGIGIFFMVIAMFSSYIKELENKKFYMQYIAGILGIFFVLSVSGFYQAGYETINTYYLWIARSFFGFVVLHSLVSFVKFRLSFSHLKLYNLAGVANDGFGGLFLLLFASFAYPLLGFTFSGVYEYVVFMFVSMTGVIHLLAYRLDAHREILTQLTVFIRICVSSIFFSLYLSGALGIEAAVIGAFDLLFASYYLLFLYKPHFK
jgi:hypothetical protein